MPDTSIPKPSASMIAAWKILANATCKSTMVAPYLFATDEYPEAGGERPKEQGAPE